jgi:hypothetical protein
MRNNEPTVWYRPTILNQKAWDTLCSWTSDVFIIDRTHIDIMYGNRNRTEIRIELRDIDSVDYIDDKRSYFVLYEDGIGTDIIPNVVTKLLRRIWDDKELENKGSFEIPPVK